MTALVESPVHGNGHAGFGGRPAETDRWQHRHRAASRPHTFRFASRKYWDQIAHDLRPVYTAASEAEALARFEEFEEKWGKPYPAISRLWRNAWTEFVPFLDYDVEIRKIICSTNAIESLNARYRRAVRARGHFPSDQAALKCL